MNKHFYKFYPDSRIPAYQLGVRYLKSQCWVWKDNYRWQWAVHYPTTPEWSEFDDGEVDRSTIYTATNSPEDADARVNNAIYWFTLEDWELPYFYSGDNHDD